MDEYLRLLQRLYRASSPGSDIGDRYIAAMERLLGFDDSDPSLIATSQDIHNLSNQIAEFIREHGIRIMPMPGSNRGVPSYFWVEKETSDRAEGLCLAINTRFVATCIGRKYGKGPVSRRMRLRSEDFQEWSVNALIFLGDTTSDLHIYEWEVIF